MARRARKVPGGSKYAVERNASRGGGVVRIVEMTTDGLRRALASATGKRAAAIERELSRRGAAPPDNLSRGLDRASATDAIRDGSDQLSGSESAPLRGHLPELPGHKVDALGRQRPDFSRPGCVSDVERIAVAGERIKRDAAFRARVLAKYGAACVICGYGVHVEAAHLTPKYELSDDRVENGAPLCPNHHWELDSGHLSVNIVRQARDRMTKSQTTSVEAGPPGRSG